MSKYHTTEQLLHQLLFRPTITCLPIQSSATSSMEEKLFPVRRIFCVGRNYREHAKEMGHDPDREPPFFFMKASDSLTIATKCERGEIDGNATNVVAYPPMTSDLHFEGELVVSIGLSGRNIPLSSAHEHVHGFAVGCDLTRRDLQAESKKKGRPWATAKAFDFAAPCGPILPKNLWAGTESTLNSPTPSSSTPSPRLFLEVNDILRQESTVDQMTWSVSETVSYLSQYFYLQPGDLLFTGTPSGVGPLQIGDRVKVGCTGLPSCEFEIGPILLD